MILLADSEGPDQTARMRSLIWAFAVCICPKARFRIAVHFIAFRMLFSVFKQILIFFTLWANSADDKPMLFFSYFAQKTSFDILCKLFPSP